MAGVLIGLPSKNIAPSATPSWAVSSANADYPVANAITLDPGEVAKATATTATLRLTWGGSQTPAVVGIINTNLGGATVTVQTNGGMSAVPVTFVDSEDGLTQHGWADLRGLSGVAGTQLNIAVTGASGNVAIGTVVVLSEAYSPRIRWGYDIGDTHPVIEHRSSYRQRFTYNIPVRMRSFRAEAHWAEDRPFWRSLWREANGPVTPFLLIPDEDDTDAFLVQFSADTIRETYTYFTGSFADDSQSGIVEVPIDVEEVCAGVAL